MGGGCSTSPDYGNSGQTLHRISSVPGAALRTICILSFNEVGAMIVPFTYKATEAQGS